MKEITLFHLDHCPYCRNARRALEELTAENPAYGEIAIDWVEESREPDRANAYDYYHVPTIFHGDEKLYEAHPGESYEDCKAQIRAALDRVLA